MSGSLTGCSTDVIANFTVALTLCDPAILQLVRSATLSLVCDPLHHLTDAIGY